MDNHQAHFQPQLGSTFYPGGSDDFQMPELISPAPQRSMQEVPAQIQDNLANLELGARSTDRLSRLQSPPPTNNQDHLPQGRSYSGHVGLGPRNMTPGHQPQRYGTSGSEASGYDQFPHTPGISLGGIADQPPLSPFPKIHNRPATVPCSDEEKEAILENARLAVLNSNDPEMQLTWAQDALIYVEVASQNDLRISDTQSSRVSTPRIEHQLRVDAVNVVTFLADQHHPKAEFMRGMWLEFGKFGFRMDKRESFQSYLRAARNGYARAEYRMGMQFETSNEIVKAIKHYSLGVDGGDAASHYRLGMMTLLGQNGQKQNFHQGIELIKFSADAADENAPQGAYIYGMLLARELPQVNVPEQYLPLNINQARYNIEKAAYLGFAKAQTKMGSAYELCQLGCDFDPALSLHYNNLAARQGEPEANMAISKWFLCGHEGVFRSNEELAFTYAQRAAQTGLPTAEFAIGYFFEIGIFVPANIKEARAWYGKAAEHGNRDAAARIEGITRSKTLSRKDHEMIAVAKIKSQRVSQHGARPERFISTVPDTPTTPSQYVKMPDSRDSYESYANNTAYFPNDPSSTSGFATPNSRPTSAFSVDPNNRPASAATIGEIPIDNRHSTPLGVSLGSERPNSTFSDTRLGDGRPASTQRVTSSNPNIQSYRPTPNGLPVSPRPNNGVNQKPLPVVDIGFTAPLDPLGADRKKRLQKSDNPNPGYPNPGYPRHSSSSLDVRPDRKSSRPAIVPAGQSYDHYGRSSSAYKANDPQVPVGRPPRQESIPVQPGPGPTSSINTSTPPPASFGANTPTPAGSNSTVGKKPGKGPSTFEEMGVPQGKKEADCIVM